MTVCDQGAKAGVGYQISAAELAALSAADSSSVAASQVGARASVAVDAGTEASAAVEVRTEASTTEGSTVAPFSATYRVYYEDTDCGGIVYHSNYLKFCERCRSDFVRVKLKFDQQEHLSAEKQGFVVSHITARFARPARLNDVLTVTYVPLVVKAARHEVYQEITNEQGELLFASTVRLAYVDFTKGTPMPIPAALKQAINELVPKVLPTLRC